MSAHISNVRPKADKVLTDIVDYVTKYTIKSPLAYDTARNCLIDTLGCGLEALEYPACTKLMCQPEATSRSGSQCTSCAG